MYQGRLTLERFPDSENPLGDDKDNAHEMTVVARDHAFNSCTLEITILVINLTR